LKIATEPTENAWTVGMVIIVGASGVPGEKQMIRQKRIKG
jgi:hypothetical protein